MTCVTPSGPTWSSTPIRWTPRVYGQDDPATLAELIGYEDPQVEHTLDMESVLTHWNDLPEREQRILTMRFYGNMTQAEIGEQLGISQMHVSRLLARAPPATCADAPL